MESARLQDLVSEGRSQKAALQQNLEMVTQAKDSAAQVLLLR